MNTVFKIFLSMSFSGGLLILVLLFGKQFWKDKISRQWQYYIWLVVILRLLLPFGPERNLMGKAYQAVDQTISKASPLPTSPPTDSKDSSAPSVGPNQNTESKNNPADNFTAAHPFQDIKTLLLNHIWIIWLVVTLILLIRKITIYQSFLRYISAGFIPVDDMELLDQLSIVTEQACIKKPIELCVNPLISSPLLIGFFHPCIVLPSTDIPKTDFSYIVLHELTHYKQRDLFYKWLVQAVVCLHWFHPLVHLMSREITKACEFSCDEAVLAKIGSDNAQNYGKTLLDAMAAVGKYKEHLGSVTLSENKQLLKERLGAIMNNKKKSTAIRFSTSVLTLCMILSAAFVGVYPAAANQPSGKLQTSEEQNSTQAKTNKKDSKDYVSLAKKYYKADSLPLFEITFPKLDKNTQKKWLKKLYANEDYAFFSVAIRGVGKNSSLLADFAEKAYDDEDITFFSILTDCMKETELELWLDKALEEGNWAFQSMLLDKLGKNDALDQSEEKQEKELAKTQTAEYKKAGVTINGKDYYYAGKLVNIFLDIRPNKSFYTLNINPKGTINIKIVRNAKNKITGIAYMTEDEVTELLEDMADNDDDSQQTAGGRTWHPQVIPVNLETMSDGEIVWLGKYTLSHGDRIWYHVLAETGKSLQIGFAKPEDTQLNTVYYFVKNFRQEDETLACTANFTVKPPVKPGTYKLFLRTTDGALTNIKGSVSIGYIKDVS